MGKIIKLNFMLENVFKKNLLLKKKKVVVAVKEKKANLRNNLHKALEKNKKVIKKTIASDPDDSATTSKNLNLLQNDSNHHDVLGLDLEDYDCSICSDIFALPTSLLCGHTF